MLGAPQAEIHPRGHQASGATYPVALYKSFLIPYTMHEYSNHSTLVCSSKYKQKYIPLAAWIVVYAKYPVALHKSFLSPYRMHEYSNHSTLVCSSKYKQDTQLMPMHKSQIIDTIKTSQNKLQLTLRATSALSKYPLQIVQFVWHTGESSIGRCWHTGESSISRCWHTGESSIGR